MTTIQDIKTASSLYDLMVVLQEMDDDQNLLEQALCDLPTFGGEAPRDTTGVFSWDARNLLVQDTNGEWDIVARDA